MSMKDWAAKEIALDRDDVGVECIDVLYALKPDGSRIEINKTYHLPGV